MLFKISNQGEWRNGETDWQTKTIVKGQKTITETHTQEIRVKD